MKTQKEFDEFLESGLGGHWITKEASRKAWEACEKVLISKLQRCTNCKHTVGDGESCCHPKKQPSTVGLYSSFYDCIDNKFKHWEMEG